MDLNRLIQLLESEKINWSQHILKKMQKRRIKIEEIWKDDFKNRR
jgi:hypothetical protein